MEKTAEPWVISSLSDAPESINEVASWHHQECLRQGLDSSYGRRRERLNKHLLLTNPVPRTWVATQNGSLCGCISLVSYHVNAQATEWDCKAPLWVSNLYVPDEYRCRGIANSLLEAVLNYAIQILQKDVWLMATASTYFYEKRGWHVVREAHVAGQTMNVMCKSLRH